MLDAIKQAGLYVSPGAVIRFFARPYIAGYSMDAAFGIARELLAREVVATIDLLGEEATNPEAVVQAKATYLELIETIAADPAFADLARRPTVSLKLSGLVAVGETVERRVQVDEGLLRENMLEVAQAAAERDVRLTIDMEDHRWTDTTLEIFRAVHDAGHEHVGTVLQSRLFRTSDDIEALPDRARIRMVIGVYREPADIAMTDKRAMKDKLLEQCARLFERGAYVELATHDEDVLTRFFADVVAPGGYGPDRYEVQMLLGVPRRRVQEQLIAGDFPGADAPVTVRLYVPYALSAADGTAYCRRRLIENPDMVTYGVLNMFGRGQ